MTHFDELKIDRQRGSRAHEALLLGATWSEVIASLDVTSDKARGALRLYADGQHFLYQEDVERGEARPRGFDAAQYTTALALINFGDDEPTRTATSPRAGRPVPGRRRGGSRSAGIAVGDRSGCTHRRALLR
ncbi:hypothetical protein ACF08N_33875 [Streptomyces sp. NPDC015127]|uniref:hypothetical protein n=1 Tax=Streptomyces sp. NPDC015127 TaxID=3364939 RepID=UPI0036FC2105